MTLSPQGNIHMLFSFKGKKFFFEIGVHVAQADLELLAHSS